MVKVYAAINKREIASMFTPETWAAVQVLGELVVGCDAEKVPVPSAVARDFDILITSWSTEKFPAEILQGPRLKLAVHAPASVRNWFPLSSIGRTFRLTQCGAEAMALPVAEMALTLALAVLRNLHLHDRGLQSSREWDIGGHGMLGRSLSNQRIGIVGLGRSGREFLRMVRPLAGPRIAVYDPYVPEATARALGIELRCSVGGLCASSDVLVNHAPSTPETEGMIGARELAQLPDGGVVINTARAAIIDTNALTAELIRGRLSAGLDVFDQEPLPRESPLFGLPNVLLTPHVAGGTAAARHQQGNTVLSEMRSFLTNGTLQHEVTAHNYQKLA